ncbi:hypothetical protein KJI95_14175 [Shewanella sp. JM162201]|uniref:Phage shock protein B n=1 Tax=Shewanella jiangmenensis TaxID=2837387 RepID=A0ABS5V5B8_9GAMM|nr:hypothetical protein [Shewanella jiangmenensis]MBT1445657.1 hypothetical protein [Shewanella jiangmenensis]
MNIAMLALLIPTIAIVAGMIVKLSDIRQSHRELSAQQDKTVSALRAEIAELKGRIEVLETLVTDEGFEVKRDINRA